MEYKFIITKDRIIKTIRRDFIYYGKFPMTKDIHQAKSLNSKNLTLVKKVGDKTQFTITRFHCTAYICLAKKIGKKNADRRKVLQ
jgi:hypothetical protein